jgi:hypothetical protein
MIERPILFNGDMVRAILEGRKTQTRRPLKGSPCFVNGEIGNACPLGQVGDRLWVRETWGVISHAFNEDGDMTEWTPDRPATHVHELKHGRGYYTGHVIYAADGKHEWAGDDDGDGEPRSAWHPSIHMPRHASRITLEIANVRIERLQDISEEDAKAEGMTEIERAGCCAYGLNKSDPLAWHSASGRYSLVWDSIYKNWDSNPWVWVIEFKPIGNNASQGETSAVSLENSQK